MACSGSVILVNSLTSAPAKKIDGLPEATMTRLMSVDLASWSTRPANSIITAEENLLTFSPGRSNQRMALSPSRSRRKALEVCFAVSVSANEVMGCLSPKERRLAGGGPAGRQPALLCSLQLFLVVQVLVDVHLIDDRLVLLVDHFPLHLQRRRDLVFIDGEVARQQ